MFPAAYIPRKLFPSIRRKDPMPSIGVITALSWAGMRGIVSLAAALSIPLTLPSGQEFPFRNLLIFLTYVVILTTLVLPATTLPSLMRWLGIKDDGESHHEEVVARIALFNAGLGRLKMLENSKGIPADLLESTATRYHRGIETLKSNLEPAAFSPLFDEEQAQRQLIRNLLAGEREELMNLRRNASIHDEVFFRLNHELDIEETRLDGQRM
jgi:CPA1 family monovalent cation:H+ antiporter